MSIPESWINLFRATKVVCEERALLHWPAEGADLRPDLPTPCAEGCPSCRLRAAYEAAGGEIARSGGVS